MYFSANDKGQFISMVYNWPNDNVSFVDHDVFSDFIIRSNS